MARTIRVEGLVARGGPAFAQSRRPDGRWDVPTLVVILQPWREAGGPIQTGELGVRRRTRLPYELWQLLMPKGRAVALTVGIDEQNRHCELLRYRGWRRGRELQAARRSWLLGRKLEDPRFGEFSFDERINSFDAQVTWRGRTVALSVPAGDEDAAAEVLAIAHRLFDQEVEWDRRIRSAIVDQLLPVYNENWRDEEEGQIAPTPFSLGLRWRASPSRVRSW